MSRSVELDQTMNERGLVSVASAADLARVSRSTLYRWIATGAVESEVTGLGTFVKRASILAKLGPTLCKAYGLR